MTDRKRLAQAETLAMPVSGRESPVFDAVRLVYIVDDDSMVRRALSFALKTAGFEPRVFISGQDFLDEVEHLSAGCVLLDIRMPDMDGIAVVEVMGNRSQQFPVVMMTGHADVEVAVRAMKLGARDFLEKPFTDADLLEVIEALLSPLPAELEAQAARLQAQASVAKLTTRETELLQGLVEGLTNKAVAIRLNISVRTVEMHRSNLMGRLGVDTLADLIRIAMLAGVGRH